MVETGESRTPYHTVKPEGVPRQSRGITLFIYLALARIGPANQEMALAILSKDARRGRLAAINALGEMGGEARSATDLLLRLARDLDDQRRRNAALLALGKISTGEPEVLTVLRDNLLNPPPEFAETRRHAIEALGNLGSVGQALVPELREVMGNKLQGIERIYMSNTIRRLGLPPDQTKMLIREVDAIR